MLICKKKYETTIQKTEDSDVEVKTGRGRPMSRWLDVVNGGRNALALEPRDAKVKCLKNNFVSGVHDSIDG